MASMPRHVPASNQRGTGRWRASRLPAHLAGPELRPLVLLGRAAVVLARQQRLGQGWRAGVDVLLHARAAQHAAGRRALRLAPPLLALRRQRLEPLLKLDLGHEVAALLVARARHALQHVEAGLRARLCRRLLGGHRLRALPHLPLALELDSLHAALLLPWHSWPIVVLQHSERT